MEGKEKPSRNLNRRGDIHPRRLAYREVQSTIGLPTGSVFREARAGYSVKSANLLQRRRPIRSEAAM